MKRACVLLILTFFSGSIFLSCKKENKRPVNGNDNTITEALSGGSFDEWELVTVGAVGFENPAGGWWASLNTLKVIGGPETVTKSTEAYAGAYAARLETKKWGDDLTIPGILASGRFDTNRPIGENLVVGQAFDKRPVSFNGFYKYTPAGADSLVILIALTRYHETTNARDTIAQAELVSGEKISEYQHFSLNLNYVNQDLPDSIHVILLSSLRGKEMQGNAGSVLLVDELSLTYD